MRNIQQDTKKMASLLRSGHKMLNLSCPICNNPIFKKKNGEMFCPICDRPVILNDKLMNESIKSNKKLKNENNDLGRVLDNKTLINLKKIISLKIQEISEIIKNENQIINIEAYLNLLQKLLDLYERI
ncbi:MAG: Sjogren's syndrome/scleroderma autoantigen 1 family protein [Promethearchaeota archaeon]